MGRVTSFPFMYGIRCRDRIEISGRRYVVVRLVNETSVIVRRTFWQWLKDQVTKPWIR